MEKALREEIEATWAEVFTEDKVKEYFDNKYDMRETSVGSSQSFTMVDRYRSGKCLYSISKTFYEMKPPSFNASNEHDGEVDDSSVRVEISRPLKFTLDELAANNRKYVDQLEMDNEKARKNAKKGIQICRSNRGDSPERTELKAIKRTVNPKDGLPKVSTGKVQYGNTLLPSGNEPKDRSVSKGRVKSNDITSNTKPRKSVDLKKSPRFK